MGMLSQQLIANLWRRPLNLIALLAVVAALAWFARLGYQQFLFLQGQGMIGLSVFNEILLPLSGLVLLGQVFLSAMAAAQLMPGFYSANQVEPLRQSVLSNSQLLAGFGLALCWIVIIPWLVWLLIAGLVGVFSDLDISRLLSTSLGLLLASFSALLLSLILSFSARNVLFAFTRTLLVLVSIMLLEITARYWWPQLHWSGIFSPLFGMRQGLIKYADLLAYAGWFSLGCGALLWQAARFRCLPVKPAYSWLAIGFIILLIAPLSEQRLDVTREQRNTLSDELAEQLQQHQETLEIVAVLDEETGRDQILRGFEILRQLSPNSQLTFSPRQALPPELQQAGQYILFRLGELEQAVAYPFEQDVKPVFELAIQQMLRRKQDWITFIEGHGEASINGNRTADLGSFAAALRDMGWPLAVQDFSKTPIISDNTKLVVIAASQHQWMAREEQVLQRYLYQGGNMLVLADPGTVIPASMVDYSRIGRYRGTLVDWQGYQSGTPHPAIVIVKPASGHPVVSQISSLLAFPWASGLQVIAPENQKKRQYQSFAVTGPGVWNESTIDSEQLAYDADKGEMQKAFSVAMSLFDPEKNQKIVVVGDSHFVSDSAINNYANKQFALNLVSWLTNQEIEVDEQVIRDNSIRPSRLGHWLFRWGLPVFLPLLLVVGWWVGTRRKSHGSAPTE